MVGSAAPKLCPPRPGPCMCLTCRVCSRHGVKGLQLRSCHQMGTNSMTDTLGRGGPGTEAVRGGSFQPGDPGRSQLEGSFWGAPREARPCHTLVLDSWGPGRREHSAVVFNHPLWGQVGAAQDSHPPPTHIGCASQRLA